MVAMNVWYNIEWLQAGFIPGSDVLRVHSLQRIMVVIFQRFSTVTAVLALSQKCGIFCFLSFCHFYIAVTEIRADLWWKAIQLKLHVMIFYHTSPCQTP